MNIFDCCTGYSQCGSNQSCCRELATSFVLIIMITCIIIAVCDPSCENGGVCASPNTCQCRPGWTGNVCQTGKGYNKIIFDEHTN